jgi:Domain of unknown function (DUF4105)
LFLPDDLPFDSEFYPHLLLLNRPALTKRAVVLTFGPFMHLLRFLLVGLAFLVAGRAIVWTAGFVNYWASQLIAHPILSFDFGPQGHLCFSIETRPPRGKAYSTIGGPYRQFELIYIAANERDVIRLRTIRAGLPDFDALQEKVTLLANGP